MITGPLDPNMRIANHLQYNLDPEEKKPFKGIIVEEALDMAYEMNILSNLCMAYAAGPAKSFTAEELETTRQDLENSQKANEDLARHLEEAQIC